MKLIAQNTTGNVATLRILDDAGVPKTGVAYNAAGLAVWYIPEGGTPVQITLTSGNWTETKFGEYEVDVPDAAYQTVQTVRIVGSLTDSVVIPDRHQVFSSIWTSLPSAAAIATAIAQYDQRDEEDSPGTIGWSFKKLRQANQAVEFVITNDIVPTTTTFSISLTAYDTSAFAHSVLLMLTGTAAEDNGVILSYTDNGTYATIVLEKPMANAPSVGDEGLIRADSHVHSVAEIAAGVWGAVTSGYSAATGTFGYVVNALSTMIEYVGGVFRYKGSAVPVAANVLPATGISAERSSGVILSPFVGETISQSITLYEIDGTTPIDLSGKSLEAVFESRSGGDVVVISNASIVVSGDDDNIVTFAYPSAVTASERLLRFSLRDDAAPRTVYLSGLCRVSLAPGVDA